MREDISDGALQVNKVKIQFLFSTTKLWVLSVHQSRDSKCENSLKVHQRRFAPSICPLVLLSA